MTILILRRIHNVLNGFGTELPPDFYRRWMQATLNDSEMWRQWFTLNWTQESFKNKENQNECQCCNLEYERWCLNFFSLDYWRAAKNRTKVVEVSEKQSTFSESKVEHKDNSTMRTETYTHCTFSDTLTAFDSFEELHKYVLCAFLIK